AQCAKLPGLSPEWRTHFANRIRGTEYDDQRQLWPNDNTE
ncbi:MAG: hypothetical protein KDB27_34305, partial [Planctomycetales bacterium]|nr:hypothetical protein [Planctomycetales bacterium]